MMKNSFFLGYISRPQLSFGGLFQHLLKSNSRFDKYRSLIGTLNRHYYSFSESNVHMAQSQMELSPGSRFICFCLKSKGSIFRVSFKF